MTEGMEKEELTLILGNQCVLLKRIEGSQNNCPLLCGRNSLDVPTQRHKKVPPYFATNYPETYCSSVRFLTTLRTNAQCLLL